jgi:hypothetical protein
VLTLCAVPGLAQQPGKLPLPPGYRPRTPPPQAQPKQPVISSAGAPGSGGTVMYFQKPADALAATGGSPAEGAVAQLNDPPRAPLAGVPDAPAADIPLPPAPPDSRYLPNAGGANSRPAPPAITIPAATAAQPKAEPQPELFAQPKGADPYFPPSTSKKQKIPSVPESEIGLPARQSIFGIVYNDPQLERAIMERIIDDRVKDLRGRIKQDQEKLAATKNAKDIQELKDSIAALEREVREQLALKKDPERNASYQFPPLPVISPPGVAYQAKTANYPPRQAILEPGYVVHRRLHFEERNAERQGWDLGPMQTLVSAAYFFGDVLAWPHSLASGFHYGFWETSAGKCAPGSTTPYYLYPPKLTASGSAFETLVIVTTAFAFLP